MSILVGLIRDKKCYIGADSIAVLGDSKRTNKDGKLFKLGNRMLVGFSGSYRAAQVVKHSIKLPSDRKINSDPFQFIMHDFIPTVRNVLSENECIYMGTEETERFAVSFIIGYKGRLFTVLSDFGVTEVDDSFTAIGCNHEYAIGAMKAYEKAGLLKKNKPFDILRDVLDIVNDYSVYVKGPYLFDSV